METPAPDNVLTPLRWDGALHLLDQRFLPAEEVWLRYDDEREVARAIRDMVVRGAPAIGCAAAYGVAVAARRLTAPTQAVEANAAIAPDHAATAGTAAHASAPSAAATARTAAELAAALEPAIELLAGTRPTAVNLFWALARMRDTIAEIAPTAPAAELTAALETRAIGIHADDIAMCRRIGRHGAALLPAEVAVLTHCNAGALATGGYGTALGVIRAAREAGKAVRVLADETRPYLQGARLTAWELVRDGFDVTIIPDGAAAHLMSRGEIDCVIVGADRIAANGDVANKIGTYALALAAARHGLPFYVAAPLSTLDLATATGADIPIEERDGEELLSLAGTRIAPLGARARYPAFDVTPSDLVTAIITDRGVARAPYAESLAGLTSAKD